MKRKTYAQGEPANPQKDRLTHSFLQFIRGKTPAEAVAGTEKDNKEGRPIAQSTIRKLRRPIRDGGTRYPRALTLQRVLEAHGATLSITQNGKIWK